MDAISLLLLLGGLAAGGAAGYLSRGRANTLQVKAADEEARLLLDGARLRAESVSRQAELEARETALKAQGEAEEALREQRRGIDELEKALRGQLEKVERRAEGVEAASRELDERQRRLKEGEEALDRERGAVEARSHALQGQLEQIAGLSADEARTQLVSAVEADARLEIGKRLKRLEDEARETADRKAKRLIAMAIQRYAGEYVAERTVSVVNLPNEDMKGRIIGREGRNIRALEAATGIDLIIDDTPEAVILSGYNPFRREIARQSLERLIADGRIHPSRIEEIVKNVEDEMEAIVREAGQQAAFDLGLHDVHPELLRLVGQLKYRTSYGQNQYKHAIEVGFLAGMMASELGMDPKVAKRAGLLHDIGKVLDHSVEGSHAVIGSEFAKKHGEARLVVNAIGAHHEEVSKESIYAVLVQAADALSGARPGARREILEGYIRRLEDLESISNSFPGVEKSYAIQAGREIRIIVSNQGVSDAEAIAMSRDIAQRIESELTYPGQIKVTVIRETRAVEYAR